jgi:hypothetical protein
VPLSQPASTITIGPSGTCTSGLSRPGITPGVPDMKTWAIGPLPGRDFHPLDRCCYGLHGDLVIQGMEAAIPILLSTAVEHALESTNPVHALGAADGPSRYGTHQSPSHPSRASMKYGPFAPDGLCCPADQHYYDPLRLPLGRPHHFPGAPVIGEASLPATPQATGPRRLSRVPTMTIRTFNAHYAGGFLGARSWNQNAFHGLRRHETGSAPSWPTPKAGPLDDPCSGFTRVADRTVAPAPLRTQPLDHARGLRYQGPRRLPGPDSHRQAALNLSLLRHVVLHFLMAPEQSRRTS